MFKPIPQHDKILFDNKCGYAFRTSNDGPVSRVVCGIIDNNTGNGFIEASGVDEMEAFDKAVKLIGKVARPFATEDAKALAEKDATIAALEAQLKAATAPKAETPADKPKRVRTPKPKPEVITA